MSEDKQENNQRENTLKRRDVLKALSAVPVAALLPASAIRAASMSMPQSQGQATQETPSAPAGPYQPKTLTPHEYKTVQMLADIIVPADERSGSATDAGVPEFLDGRLGYRGGLDTIRGGITWLDLESNRGFGHDFVDAAHPEQKQLLDRIAYPKKAAPEDAAGVVFFSRLRDMVLGGFYSSKMGVRDLPYLGNQMLAEWNGCPPNVLAKLGFSHGTKS